MTPLKDRVLVELIQKETTTSSGIILSSADPMEANRGKVLSIGPEVLDVAAGDVILANWNKAAKTKVDGNDFYILKEEDIIGVFEGTGFIETPNAITLRNRMQFITLSDYERARKSFDYIHCLPFYDILNDQFHISMEQWKSIKNKKLVRQYLTLVPSSHRAAKYRERGWKV